MGVREPRIPLRYLQIDPAASRHVIMSMSRSVILVCCLAKVMASVRSFSVMEG